MNKLYFFTSSVEKDEITRLTIVTNSPKRALMYAIVQFVKHHCKGTPVSIALYKWCSH